jgi:dihydrofolate synthase/folylpolyglutamate synthase
LSLDLQSAIERLYGLERRKDKLGLDGERALMRALGNPERRFRSVHVAGTNGKGSVCARIERVLREAGLRTGLFTSPHLVDFRERIRVGGRWADEERLAQRLEHIQALPGAEDRTFFEVCTALAFDDFAARGVEWAVVEVGLGGRLDCTNVITPEVCAITSIGLDHTEILGDTIERIAAEKAGIIKPDVPVVVAPGLDARALAVIAGIAAQRGAELVRAQLPAGGAGAAGQGDAAAASGLRGAAPDEARFPGAHQRANLATALAVLGTLERRGLVIPPEALRRGLERARWPGRFEPCPAEPRLWWDGAHNPDGVRALIAAWNETFDAAPEVLVLALSRDKDAVAIVRAIANAWPAALTVMTRTLSERALAPEELARAAREAELATETADGVAGALRRALARGGEGRVLLTGSLFAIGEAMEALGGAPGEWQ